jgi:tRNA-splicing ligase RtcB
MTPPIYGFTAADGPSVNTQNPPRCGSGVPPKILSTHSIVDKNMTKIKWWTEGVEVEEKARQQVLNISQLPFVTPHVAVMPDVHWGKGATVGSVIPTENVIIPSAVGVDIGCGMMAVKTNLTALQLPDNLASLRSAIEAAIPHGRTERNDIGSWSQDKIPDFIINAYRSTVATYEFLLDLHPKLKTYRDPVYQVGTLGTGNHFIEICLDEKSAVWLMLHSGSRGVGHSIGRYFIEKAKEEMLRWDIHLSDVDLSYLPEGSQYFDHYVVALDFAQNYAENNRRCMMRILIDVLKQFCPAMIVETWINCHHNYVSKEKHFGKELYITRKGAVSAKEGELGIIPGSMGAKSFIIKGKGHSHSFHSCSHGAGRKISRNEAKKLFTLDDHIKATQGVECRKDAEIIDETPGAYKDIDSVIAAQSDLIEIEHILKQILCVKG